MFFIFWLKMSGETLTFSLLLLLRITLAKVVLEQVDSASNAKLLTINTTVGTTPDGLSSLSADAYVLKSLGSNILIKNDVYEMENNQSKLIISIPKFNYCRMKELGDLVPYAKNVMKELSRFGNMVQSCPMQAGHYYLHDGYVNETGLYFDKIMKLGVRYMVKCEAVDASKRRPMFIFRLAMTAYYKVD